jgi:hypothetical protein
MNCRQFLKKGSIAVLTTVLLLADSPTQAGDSTSSVTVLIAYHSVFWQYRKDGPRSRRGGEGRFRH